MDEKLICVVLTGGKSSRMNNQNKSFLKIKEINFIENIVNSLKEKTSLICINANKDFEKYKYLDLKIIEDEIKGYKGPLAGLHSVMYYYKETYKSAWFAIFPTDAPIINTDLIDLFYAQKKIKVKAFISKINNKIEPMFSFWSLDCFSHLDKILRENDGYKIMKFAEEVGFDFLEISKKNETEFFNVNDVYDYKYLVNLIKNH